MKTLRAIAIALFIPVAAWSQVSYNLPATVLNLDVTAVKETYVAGPYARYAKQYLGIDVPTSDYCKTTITEIKVYNSLVADMSATYTINSWSRRSKFLALTTQGLIAFEKKEDAAKNTWTVVPSKAADGEVVFTAKVPADKFSMPIPWEVAPSKPLEIQAKDAAEVILSARRERYNITIGNTDATFSGESLGAALAELTRLEEEYLPLFIGTKTVEEQHGFYSVCPVAARKEHHYPAFAISKTEGLIPSGTDADEIYYLDLTVGLLSNPGIMPVVSNPGKHPIHYRVPAICDVKLTGEDTILFSTQLPVYQLGREVTCPSK